MKVTPSNVVDVDEPESTATTSGKLIKPPELELLDELELDELELDELELLEEFELLEELELELELLDELEGDGSGPPPPPHAVSSTAQSAVVSEPIAGFRGILFI